MVKWEIHLEGRASGISGCVQRGVQESRDHACLPAGRMGLSLMKVRKVVERARIGLVLFSVGTG